MLLLAAPLAEELVFRGGVMEALLRSGRSAGCANALATAAFSLAHALARGWLLAAAVIVPSWLLGALYARERRVTPCIAWHALFNAAWIVLAPTLVVIPSP